MDLVIECLFWRCNSSCGTVPFVPNVKNNFGDCWCRFDNDIGVHWIAKCGMLLYLDGTSNIANYQYFAARFAGRRADCVASVMVR